MIEIKYDDQDVQAALEQLARHARDLKPALRAMGEHLLRSTKQRFTTSTAPDGNRWPANSTSTLAKLLRDRGGPTSMPLRDFGKLNDAVNSFLDSGQETGASF